MRKFRYTGAIIALTSVLLAFLITGTLLVTWQQRVMLVELETVELSQELDLMADAFYESLLKSDYMSIRTFVERWGSVHEEFLVIRAVAPNGFVIGESLQAPGRNARTIELNKTITIDSRHLMTLSITADISKSDLIVTKLRNRLLAGSVLFTVILGSVLWRSQRRMALAPLEHEIERRQRAEKELQHAHNGLESVVYERTAELAQREERIRLLLDSTAEGIYGIDTSGNCIFCNPSGRRMLGYGKEEDILGRNMHALIHHKRPDGSPHPEQDCKIYSAYRENRGSHADTEVFWRANGTSFPVEYWSYPIESKGAIAGAVVTFFDITDRQKLEAQLIQSQKMEAIGTLAGGVAHDFNNILTAIIGYGSILQRKMSDADPLKAGVVNILESAQRAARLTRNLLTFGRKQSLTPVPVDLNSVIRRVEKLLLPLIGEDIELASELSDDDLIVQADAGQIEQVLMNLATNARDAMPQGGCFTIRSEQAMFDAEQARLHGVPAAGVVRGPFGLRHGLRYGRSDPAQDLRALLYHQGSRPGHRSRSGHGLRHHPSAQRHDLRLQRDREGHDVQDLPAAAARDGRRRSSCPGAKLRVRAARRPSSSPRTTRWCSPSYERCSRSTATACSRRRTENRRSASSPRTETASSWSSWTRSCRR